MNELNIHTRYNIVDQSKSATNYNNIYILCIRDTLQLKNPTLIHSFITHQNIN